MNWQDILKKEKAHCGSEKTDEEPIIEKIPDLSGDGKVTRKDVLIGRGVYDKKGNKVKKAKAGGIRGLILREIQKEGGALGYSHLNKKFKQLNPSQIKGEVMALVEDGKAYIHGDGDIISIKKPSRGRGFTA